MALGPVSSGGISRSIAGSMKACSAAVKKRYSVPLAIGGTSAAPSRHGMASLIVCDGAPSSPSCTAAPVAYAAPTMAPPNSSLRRLISPSLMSFP